MRSLLLTVLLFVMFFNGLHGKSKMTDSSEEAEPNKALRRSEISKALGLLKKHSVVGKNAKIVLKASGRNLLVDPSERLQVVSSHLSSSSLETHKAAASTNKSSKLTAKPATKAKNGKSTGKASTKKRASGGARAASKESVNSKESSLSSSSHTTTSLSSSSSSLSFIQQNIMRKAASQSATVIDSLMGSTMLEEITRLVSAIVRNMRTHSLAELSDLITETLDEHFGRHWHTVSVATSSPPSLAADQPKSSKRNSNQSSSNKSAKDVPSQLNALQTHVAIDDHRKSSTFYVTYDFGPTLRIYIFK